MIKSLLWLMSSCVTASPVQVSRIFPRVWRQQEGKHSSRNERGVTFHLLSLLGAGPQQLRLPWACAQKLHFGAQGDAASSLHCVRNQCFLKNPSALPPPLLLHTFLLGWFQHMFIQDFNHMNLSKIMEWELLRSLVNSSPRMAGGNSFTHWACPLKSLICLRTLWLVLWFLTLCECSGTEAVSSRSLSRQPLLRRVTNAIHLLVKSWFFDSPFLAVFLYSAAWNKARQRCCCLPGLEKIAQQHCLYWCKENCLVHIAGTSKHILNKGTSREGPWGNPSTNVLPWRAACVSCQLLKGLWSFGGNLQPSTQLREGLYYSGELRSGVCVFWVNRPLKISLDT